MDNNYLSFFFHFQGIEDEDRQWNEKLDDEDEYEIPYSFVPKKTVLSKNNRDITLPSTVSLLNDNVNISLFDKTDNNK